MQLSTTYIVLNINAIKYYVHSTKYKYSKTHVSQAQKPTHTTLTSKLTLYGFYCTKSKRRRMRNNVLVLPNERHQPSGIEAIRGR